jgi:hypothetical protein
MTLSRRFFVAYLLLVGVPFGVLLGVLHFGRRVAAPAAVDGIWTVTANQSDVARSHCTQSTWTKLSMTISQSGPNLVIELHPVLTRVALGEVRGRALTAATAPSAPTTALGCDPHGAYSVSASLDENPTPVTLAGALHLQGCRECASINFRAVRINLARGRP